MNEKAFNRVFEIGGPDVLTYRKMLLEYAAERGYKRLIITLPFGFMGLSATWIYFSTPANYTIAKLLVQSMKNDVVCKETSVREVIPQELYTYRQAIQMAFARIEQNMVISSWHE